ncbi:unnamed protein product [Moneuplotes crassus]|uniref:Uncharacterized protein n=1 Tax=Euplotes crassus TaxID=5936 RepID=A0AAD1Y0H8_EUPCR|nr:unnamed protein product [Moneuplotes crassus]
MDVENIKDDAEIGLYKEDHFKDYVKEKYNVESESYLDNSNILKMVYALEWFNIKKNNSLALVKYHPNITNRDYQKALDLENQQIIDQCACFFVSSLICNRLLLSRFNRRVFRYPVVTLISSIFTFGMTYTVLDFLINKEITNGLEQYLELHYDADAMKRDLEETGISIKAKYYDKEEVQSQVDKKEKE